MFCGRSWANPYRRSPLSETRCAKNAPVAPDARADLQSFVSTPKIFRPFGLPHLGARIAPRHRSGSNSLPSVSSRRMDHKRPDANSVRPRRQRQTLRFRFFRRLAQHAPAAGLPDLTAGDVQCRQPAVIVAVGVNAFDVTQVEHLAVTLFGVTDDDCLARHVRPGNVFIEQ